MNLKIYRPPEDEDDKVVGDEERPFKPSSNAERISRVLIDHSKQPSQPQLSIHHGEPSVPAYFDNVYGEAIELVTMRPSDAVAKLESMEGLSGPKELQAILDVIHEDLGDFYEELMQYLAGQNWDDFPNIHKALVELDLTEEEASDSHRASDILEKLIALNAEEVVQKLENMDDIPTYRKLLDIVSLIKVASGGSIVEMLLYLGERDPEDYPNVLSALRRLELLMNNRLLHLYTFRGTSFANDCVVRKV